MCQLNDHALQYVGNVIWNCGMYVYVLIQL